METSTRRRLIALIVCLLAAWPAARQAHGRAPAWPAPSKAPAPEPAPRSTELPPTINPNAAPSLSLGPFIRTHLDKILVPLGTPAFAQAELVADMRANYAQALSAADDAHKPAYQLAVTVCDALTGAIAERQKAVAAMDNSYDLRLSESVQPRGGAQAVHASDRDEWFFYNSQKNNWLQNAATLRQQIAALYQRERAAETRVGDWSLRVVTPLVSVPPPSPDPVVGRWMYEGRSPLTLEADHSISGSRDGTWEYTCTTDAGRNYEMHWQHKGWVDYLVLSPDGKVLDGKGHHNHRVSANR